MYDLWYRLVFDNVMAWSYGTITLWVVSVNFPSRKSWIILGCMQVSRLLWSVWPFEWLKVGHPIQGRLQPLDAIDLDQGWRVLLGVFPCSPMDWWHGKGDRGIRRRLVGQADPTKWDPNLPITSTCFLYTYFMTFIVFSSIQTLLQVQVELGRLSTKIQEMWCVLPSFWVKCWRPK
jgi:hypothetical protein